jgi:isoaspartyl peptidase/L-asparaginase-like protein (Ntn-hydrolase superfamily)
MERNSTNGKVKSAKLLIKHGEEIDQAFEKAVEDALQKHQRVENTIAVWRNEKVQLIKPEEVLSTKK